MCIFCWLAASWLPASLIAGATAVLGWLGFKCKKGK